MDGINPMNNGLYIIHLSDLQFGSANRIKPKVHESKEDAIKRFASTLYSSIIKQISQDLLKRSLIIVTGDIANESKENEYQEAVLFFEELMSLLQLNNERIVLIHGNHDINKDFCKSVRTSKKIADDKNIEIWQKYVNYEGFYNKFYKNKKQFDSKKPSTIHHYPDLNAIIIAVDSCLYISDINKHGYIHPDYLDNLIDRANRIDPNHELIWFAAWHHHVIPRDQDDFEYVTNAREIIRKLAKNNVDIILHGHEHQEKSHIYGYPDSSFGGIVSIMGAGSTGVDLESRPVDVPNQYSIIEIRDGWVSRSNFQWKIFDQFESKWESDAAIGGRAKELYPLLSSSHGIRDRQSFMNRMAKEIRRAKKSIHFIAESFHDKEYLEKEIKQIEDALKGKDIDIYECITSDGTQQLKGFLKQRNHGVDLYIDPNSAHRAFRYTIFDKSRVLLHFRPRGLDKSIHGETIESPELAKILIEDFKKIKKRAQLYEEYYYFLLNLHGIHVEDWVEGGFITQDEGKLLQNDIDNFLKQKRSLIKELTENWKQIWAEMPKSNIPSTTKLPIEICPYIAGRDKLIEVGCGTGNDIIPLSYLCTDGAIGIDINPEVIEEAKSRVRQLDKKFRPKVAFQCKSIELFKEQADVILLKAFLTVVPGRVNRQQILEHILSLVKNDGLIIIYDFKRYNENPIYKKRYEKHTLYNGDDGDFMVTLPDNKKFIAHHLDSSELEIFEKNGFKEKFSKEFFEISINGNELRGILLIYEKTKG